MYEYRIWEDISAISVRDKLCDGVHTPFLGEGLAIAGAEPFDCYTLYCMTFPSVSSARRINFGRFTILHDDEHKVQIGGWWWLASYIMVAECGSRSESGYLTPSCLISSTTWD